MPLITEPQHTSCIAGKKQNCASFGTYEPPNSLAIFAALCHGGDYNDRTYKKCPVHDECRDATRACTKKGEAEEPQPEEESEKSTEDEEAEDEEAADEEKPKSFKRKIRSLLKAYTFKFCPPDMDEVISALPTSHAPSENEPEEEEDELEEEEPEEEEEEEDKESTGAERAPVSGRGSRGQIPRTMTTDRGSPPGTRSFFLRMLQHTGELFPTYTPREGESPWARLGKNIVQGVLSSIGFAIWNFCRGVDLFG
jgi:hypothetical protein